MPKFRHINTTLQPMAGIPSQIDYGDCEKSATQWPPFNTNAINLRIILSINQIQ